MADGGQTSRAGNALQKRQESLKRWKGSETDRQPVDRSKKKAKIQFNSGTVFLSAVSSGDVDEVKKLLAKGTDINYQNVDGLTALHQACIDETFDLVKTLISSGARLDIRDNEGWTPLHAAASCGSVEIAKYLVQKGADVAAVNNEGELPLDLAEEEDMEDLLTDEIERLGIDAEEARNVEETLMLEDAQSWLNKNCINDSQEKSGATSLHVAASKGYLKVIALLLQLNVDPNAKDDDGWTPLHAAAHWGQTEACEVLADSGADFNARNKVDQTPIDLAEPDMVKILEELKKRQNDRSKIKANAPLIKSNLESNAPPPLKRRSSITRIKDQNLFLRDINQERLQFEASREKDSVTPVKPRYSKVPSFSESPKEDKEKEQSFEYGKESESESETGSESSSDASSSGEEVPQPITLRKNASVSNSITSRQVNAKTALKSESSESESESEEEKPAAPTTRWSRTNQTSTNSRTTATRPQSTPASVTTPATKQAPATGLRGLRSPFLSKDKDKPPTPTSPIKTEPSKGFGSRLDREDKKEAPSSRTGSYPVRTTAATTGTTTNTTTSTGLRGRAGSAASQDGKDDANMKRRGRRVTARAGTAFVGNASLVDDDDDDESKSNDVASKDAKTDSSGSDLQSRRSRLPGSATEKDTSEETKTPKRGRLEQNKENEEKEMSNWRRKRLAREQEREQREKEEKEKALGKERAKEQEQKEKDKEKERAEPSYRRRFKEREREREQKEQKVREQEELDKKEREKSEKMREDKQKEADVTISPASRGRRPRRLRENRRGTGVAYMPSEESGEDSSQDAKDALKNAKANENIEEKSSYSRRRLHDRDSDDSKSTDRIRGSRSSAGTAAVTAGTTGTAGTAGTVVTPVTEPRVPLSTAKANTIRITETDPRKLKQQLQEAHIEIQQYKVKLETTTQEKEKLEQKLTQLTEDLKQLTDLKSENQRLKEENGALIRVISKMSKPQT